MPHLFVGNFSFEQLRDRKDQLPIWLRRFEAAMSSCWMAVADEGDFILCEYEMPTWHQQRLISFGCPSVTFVTREKLKEINVDEVTCWGWTKPMGQLCNQHHLPFTAPSQDAIWKVNSRVFSVELELEFSCGIPLTRVIHSEDDFFELRDSVGSMPHSRTIEYLFKPEFSQSGRGQFLSTLWSQNILELLFANNRKTETVIAEPFVKKHREVGCQWVIKEGGDIEFLGAVELFSSDRGAYLGSATGITTTNFTNLEYILQTQQRALERIAAEGYFGPVGIDAMLYYNKSNVLCVRPLQDINARWTMGRIALEWPKIFGKPGRWMSSKDQPHPDAILTSPQTIDGTETQHKMWWIPGDASDQWLSNHDNS